MLPNVALVCSSMRVAPNTGSSKLPSPSPQANILGLTPLWRAWTLTVSCERVWWETGEAPNP
jgi:hypothetical protein